MSLPSAAPHQAYCNVSVLEGGLFDAPGQIFVMGADDLHTAPSLSFLITHSISGARMLFDLGFCDLSREDVPVSPAMRELIKSLNCRVPQDVPASLRKGGLEPGDIETVVLSHLHQDHTADPKLYTRAQFFVGATARPLVENGYPKDPKSLFVADLFPEGRVEWLDPSGAEWKAVGPFARALDFWGDGALYIVDAPGHMLGHQNVLVRTSPDGGWLYLAGDAAHDWRLLRGEGDIAVSQHPVRGTDCAHSDIDAAKDTIKRIKELMKISRVRVIFAHDNEYYDKNKDTGEGFWPGSLPSL